MFYSPDKIYFRCWTGTPLFGSPSILCHCSVHESSESTIALRDPPRHTSAVCPYAMNVDVPTDSQLCSVPHTEQTALRDVSAIRAGFPPSLRAYMSG